MSFLDELKDRARVMKAGGAQSDPPAVTPHTVTEDGNEESSFLGELRSRARVMSSGKSAYNPLNLLNTEIGNWASGYSALTDEYGTRFEGLAGSYKDAWLGETGQWVQDYNIRRTQLDEQAKHIRGLLQLHSDKVDPASVKEITDMLDNAVAGENQMEQGYKLYNDFYGQFEGEDAYKQWQDDYFHTAEGAAADRQAWEKETREKIRTMPEGAERTELEDKLRRYERGEGEWGTYSKFVEKGDPLEKTASAYQTGFTNSLMDRGVVALQDQEFLNLAERTAAAVHIPDAEEAARYDQLKHAGYDMVYPEYGQPYAVSRYDGAVMVYRNGEYIHPELLTGQYNYSDKLGIYLSMDAETEGEIDTSLTNVRSQAVAEARTKHWDMLKPEEITVYYGLLGQEPATAAQYLEQLQPTLNHRFQNQETMDTVKAYREARWDEKAGMSLTTVPANLASGVTGFITIALDKLRGKDTDFYGRGFEGMHYSNTVRGERAAEFNRALPNLNILGLGAGDIYQAGMSGLDSLSMAFVPGGAAALGMSAGANKGYELHQKGASSDQIFAGAVTSAAIEGAMEKMGLDKLKLLKAKDVNSWVDFLLNVVKQMGTEYGEEFATEIVNGAADLINRTSESDWARLMDSKEGNTVQKLGAVAWDVLVQSHEAGMAGAISGGGHAVTVGTVNAGRGVNASRYTGSQIKAGTAGMTLEQLKALAGTVDPAVDPGLAKYAAKTTEDSGDGRVGNLYRRTVAGMQSTAVTDALRQIEAEGYSPAQAEQILEVADRINAGQRLTEKQQALWEQVESNPNVMEAASVLVGIDDNTRKRGNLFVGREREQEQEESKDPYALLRESVNPQTIGNESAPQPAMQAAPQTRGAVTGAEQNAANQQAETAAQQAYGLRNENANQNGGMNDANAQYAAAQGTADGGSVLYGGGQRHDGASAGQPVGGVGSRAGQDPQRRSDWADSRREGVRRKNLIQDIRGSAEAVSSKSQGIQTGTDNATMRIVPEEKHTEAMKAEAERIYQETGKQVRYVVGPIEVVGKDGKTRSARGVTTADGIFVRLDHSTPAEKIGRHESFHGMLDAYGEFTGRKTILDGILEELRKNFTPEQIESVLTKYHEALRGVYSADRNSMDQNILEEMLADAYAGINAFGAGATKFSEAVQGFMRDNHMSRETTQDNGTEQPTGPPSQNRTFQEEIDAQMRGEPAGQKENTTDDGGAKYCLGESEDTVRRFVEAAYRKENTEDIKRYAEVSDRLLEDVAAEIDLTGYVHALRDNDIRHIRNSHGEETNEKYPVTKDDLSRIPEIVENYDKVYVKTNARGIPGLVYVTVEPNNVVYYVEAVTTEYYNEKLLVNKQMVKTGIDEIPNLHGLIAAINKKESSSQYLADLQEIRKAYVQDVKGSRSMEKIPYSSSAVKQQIQTVLDKVSTNHAAQMEKYTELKDSDPTQAQSYYDNLMAGPYAAEFGEYLKLTEQLEKLKAGQEGTPDTATENGAGSYTGRASLDDEVRYSLDEDSALADKAIAKNDSLGFVDDTVLEEAKELRERTADQLRSMKENGVAIPDDIKGNTAISNSSYDITEENTTICPRSLASEAFVDAVSEYLGRPLTVEEQIYISQDLQGRSLTPECTYCYVATDRKAYRAFLGDYIKQRDAVLEKLKADPDADVSRSGDLYKEFLDSRKDTNPMWGRFKMWVDAYKGGKPMIDGNHLANMSRLMGDINSEFGAELKPQIVDAMKYAQSASWAKKRVSYVAYDGHILNWKQNRIDKLNSHYGLRMYSFSDFHPAFVLENMQMITDAAVRGLKMLGYTKDTDFVEIFAPTGMNINVSTFGFEVGGNVYENNIIGANWEKARALREQHPNVGITFVATNDAMVEWALAQEWIDVVIPFHLVRTGEAVAKAYGFENFTKESSDTKAEGWSREKDSKYIAPTVHNNDKATYLAALKKNNLKPRFERWIDDPNYMKLVNECRQSASQSRPVQPIFNEEAIDTVLAKLKANGYYQPVGGSVERMYEIAAQVAENMGDDLKAVDTSKSGWAQDLPARYSLDDAEVDVDEAKEQLVEALQGIAPQQSVDGHIRQLIDQYTTEQPVKPQAPKLKVDRGNLRRALNSSLGISEADAGKLTQALDAYTEAVSPKKPAKKQVELDVESKPTRAKRNLQDKLLNLFSIPTGQRAAMNSYIGSWADRIVKNGALTEADRKAFFAKMYESGAMTMPADEFGAVVREYMKGGRIYVADSVVADFGDDWESIRKRAFAAGIYLTRQRVTDGKQNAGIDSWNGELAEQLPWLFDSEGTDRRSMLEQIVKLAEEGKEEKISLAEYTAILAEQEFVSEAEVLDNLERQMDFALRTFAETADIEIQLKERNLRQRLKEQADNKEARDKRKAANELRELQQRTLKTLQWLNRNRNRAPEELREAWDEVLGDIDLYAVGAANEMNWSEKHNATWKDLAQMYKDAMTSDPNFLPSEELQKIVTRLDATKIGDMDLGALQDLYKAAIGLRTEFHNRNNVINDEMQRLFAEVYTDSKKEIESAPGGYTGKGLDKLFNMEQLTPMNYLQRMGGWDPNGAFYSMAKQLEKGERDIRRYTVQANAMLQEFLEENQEWVKRADGQGKDGIWYEVEIPELLALELGKKPEFGNTVKVYMTPAQKVHMYLESKNQDNLRHMTGGRTFVDRELYSKGKRQEALSQGRTIRIAPETVKKIVADLTQEEMELARLLENYYNSFATGEINRVSNILYGYDKAMGKNYAPIYTNRNYTKTEFGVFDVTAEGVGNLKGRQHAVNPSYNISALDAFERHVDQTARFVGMAIPARNWTTLMNWREKNNSTADVITHKWGEEGKKYITDLITTLQAGDEMKQDVLSSSINTLQSNYISAVFGANPSIVLKQLGSIPLAGAYLGMSNLPTPSQMTGIDRKLIEKYTPDLTWRTMGYTTMETKHLKENPNWTQTNKFFRFTFGGGAITAMDGWAASTLWPWAENKVRKEFPNIEVGTQEQIDNGESPFYKKVAELFEDAVSRSQSVSDEIHQGRLRKSKNPFTRAFTLFRSDSAQTYNTIRQKIGEAQYLKRTGAKEEAQKAARVAVGASVGALLVNALWGETVSFLMALWKNKGKKYRDDDEEMTVGSVISESVMNILGQLAGVVTGGEELFDVIGAILTGEKWYGIDTPGMEQLNDMVEAVITAGGNMKGVVAGAVDVLQGGGDLGKYFASKSGMLTGVVKDVAEAAGMFLGGLPVGNVEGYLMGLLKWISPELGAGYDDLFTDPGKSELEGLTGNALSGRMQRVLDDRGVEVDDQTVKELGTLYETGHSGAFPADVPGSITIKEKTHELSAMQQQTYDRVWSGVVSGALDELVGSEAYRNADKKTRAKMLGRLYSYANGRAKDALFDDYELTDTDAKTAKTVAAGIDLASYVAWASTTGEMKTHEKFAELAEWDLDEKAKKALVGAILGTDMKTENGNPTQYAKFLDAVEGGLGVDEYIDLRADGVEIDKYLKYHAAGLDPDAAADLSKTMDALEGEDEDLSDVQKWRAAVDSQTDVADQLAALSVVMTESQHRKATVANDYQLRPKTWVQVQEMLPRYDADGNGSYKQAEVKTAVDAIGRSMGLSDKQKAAMWQLITGSTSAKNNPYSTSVGQQVVDKINKLKQSEDGNSLSFSEEIAKQFAARW